MGDGDINSGSVTQLIRAVDGREDYAFLIGAGTSRPSPAEIPTGGELIEQWKREHYVHSHRDKEYDFEDFDRDEFDEWVDTDEFEAWVERREEQMDGDNEYGFWFEERHPTRGERRERIQDLVEGATPTFAHVLLASMMDEGYVPHVLTPNFDDLLFDAFYLYLEDKPQMIDHRAVAPEFRLTHSESAIVKLHGDYLYDNLRNTSSETASKALDEGMRDALRQTVEEYGLVVVGYSGGDDSIMDPLIDADTSEYGIYWCTRDADSFSDEPKAEELLEQSNTYLVEIEGFGSLMRKFGSRIDGLKLPQPSKIVERAEERADRLGGALEETKEDVADDEEEEFVDKTEKFWEADDLRKEGNYEEAIELFSGIIEQDSEFAGAYLGRGFAKQELEEYEEAISDFDTAIDLNPDYAIAYHNRGYAKSELGEYEEAIADYDTAIDLDPDDAKAYYNRGIAKFELGEYEEAIADYDTAINLDHDHAYVYHSRGNAKKELGEYEEAIADYDTAIDLNPDYKTAYNSRGEAKRKLGKYEEAITDYDTAIDLDPDYTYPYNNRGLTRAELGEYEEAIADYDTAIDLDSDYTTAYHNRGDAKYVVGEYEGAIADYDTAIDLDPDDATAYYKRGYAKHELGEYEGAIADYDTAIDLNPDYKTAYLNRAGARMGMGDFERARQDAREAKEVSESTDESATSTLFYLISSIALGEDVSEEETEYRNLCEKDFTTSWDPKNLDSWLEATDLEADKTCVLV